MTRAYCMGFGLSLGVLLGLISPSLGGPAVASRYNEIKIPQEECLKNAEEALLKTGLGAIERTRESRYGTRGDYTGVVRCIAGNGLVMFIGSGPSRQITDNLAGTLFENFVGGIH